MITVSIVTYKTDLQELSHCLKSLVSPLISKVYIVDNSSSNNIANFCTQYSNIVYIKSDNVGYGAGHNKALRLALKSNAKYHIVLNSDVYFDSYCIDKLIAYMEANNDIAQVQPNIIYPDGTQQYTCRLLPTPIDLIFRRFFPKFISKKINKKFLLEFWDHKHALNIPFHMGCFMLLRMQAIKEVGIFDEKIFMYTEDIDLTRRIHKKYKTMYWPEVTIIHAHKQGSYKNRKLLLIHIKSAIIYFNKWGWLFDKDRRKWNRDILKGLGYYK